MSQPLSNNKIKTNEYTVKRSRLFYFIMRTKVLGCSITNTGLRDFSNFTLTNPLYRRAKGILYFRYKFVAYTGRRGVVYYVLLIFVRRMRPFGMFISPCFHFRNLSSTYRKKLCVALLDLVVL